MNHLSTAQIFAVWVLPVLFAITVHEVAHGWLASKLGDKTALIMGRLTLNPIRHIDPVGTILIPGVLLILSSMLPGGAFIFGWAKPVPVNWNNLNHPRRDMAWVALAGPCSNLLMALIWAVVAKLGLILLTRYNLQWASAIRYMGEAGILINLMLMYLNLIPIPPLDGSRVVSSLLPPRTAAQYERLEPFGFFILLFLLAVGFLKYLLFPVMLTAVIIGNAFGIHMSFL